MSRETWEILQQMEPKDVELQLALQCAPLIAGLKPSNLFNIPCEGVCQVRELIRDTGISMYVLFSTGRKAAVLLYRRESLEKYMEQEPVVGMLHKLGYQDTSLEAVLPVFRMRYRRYMQERRDFPHEMGLLLGYPVEDVRGFIEHQGRDYLCTGYWKVYENREQKQQLFQRFEYAKENLVLLLSYGVGMADIWTSSAGPDKRRCTGNVQVRSDGRTLKKIQCPFLYHGNFFCRTFCAGTGGRLDK